MLTLVVSGRSGRERNNSQQNKVQPLTAALEAMKKEKAALQGQLEEVQRAYYVLYKTSGGQSPGMNDHF